MERGRAQILQRPHLSQTSLAPAAQPPPKSKTLLNVIIGIITLYCLMIFYFALPMFGFTKVARSEQDVKMLYNLIEIQNKTIHTMMRNVKSFPFLLNFY
jgi:hypothetical protein